MPLLHRHARRAHRIASDGDIDPNEPASTRPELRAVRDFLATLTRTPDDADASGVAGLPEDAVLEALRAGVRTVRRDPAVLARFPQAEPQGDGPEIGLLGRC